MTEFIMLVGVPGSGKSTWAQKQEGYVWLSSDNIREEFEYTLSDAEVFRIMNHRLQMELPFHNVIYDATNLSRRRRQELLSMLRHKYVKVHYTCIYFDVPLATALERNAERTGRARVPESVIRRMYVQLMEPDLCVESFDTLLKM